MQQNSTIGLCLAVIAVLAIMLVCAVAYAVRANKARQEISKRFGLSAPLCCVEPRRRPLRAQRPDFRPKKRDELRREVDALVAAALDQGEFPDNALGRACRYALQGGQRLRGTIVLEIARKLGESRGGARVDAAEAALFVEYLHAASLVLDDLPLFDDDATRRGRASLHALVGERLAGLAAGVLTAVAFRNLCRQIDWVRSSCPEIPGPDRIAAQLLAEACRALGADGAIGGQFFDALPAAELRQALGNDGPLEVTRLKTGAIFELAFVVGWAVCGGELSRLADIRLAGQQFGLAYQIADDLADAEQDAERQKSGRPGHNVAIAYGAELARSELNRSLAACRRCLERENLWSPLWAELEKLVRGRGNVAGPLLGAAARPFHAGPSAEEMGGSAARSASEIGWPGVVGRTGSAAPMLGRPDGADTAVGGREVPQEPAVRLSLWTDAPQVSERSGEGVPPVEHEV